MAKVEKLRIVELFSGIGGMRYAVEKANIDYEVVAALDINDVANLVYKHNFGAKNHFQSNICGINLKQINKWNPNTILMSPPCQPFTRNGLKKDVSDARTQPFLHILQLIPQISSLNFILVENVKGFEDSEARHQLVDTLKQSQFNYQEFLISPNQIGIPNSRLRYYLIATKQNFLFGTKSELWTDISPLESFIKNIVKNSELSLLESYLENLSESEKEPFRLPDKILSKQGEVLDIVQKSSKGSCCFTKSYGRYAEGTGSVIQENGDLTHIYERARKDPENYSTILKELHLRYFTPREISKLLGFPESFGFPKETSNNQAYRVLGNSLNVTVVAFLLILLTSK